MNDEQVFRLFNLATLGVNNDLEIFTKSTSTKHYITEWSSTKPNFILAKRSIRRWRLGLKITDCFINPEDKIDETMLLEVKLHLSKAIPKTVGLLYAAGNDISDKQVALFAIWRPHISI